MILVAFHLLILVETREQDCPPPPKSLSEQTTYSRIKLKAEAIDVFKK